jgi:phosphoglycolate phosphatase
VTIRGLIYDHDGTLIDSIDLVVQATNAALASAGFPTATRETVMRGMVLPTLERMGYHVGSEDAGLEALLAERYYAEAWRIGATAARPYPGIAELLEEMHGRGLKQAMLSNNQGRFIREILAAHRLDTRLDPILGEEDVPAPKPAGEGILAIARLWSLAPGEILLVGDSSADAGAAQAAGSPSVGVTWGTHSRADLASAGFDRLIDRPEDLPAVLERS